jgi:hypothetical protein
MSQLADNRVTSGPPAPASTARFLLRVCTKNPFYVISAGLFLVGVRVSQVEHPQTETLWSLVQTWALMSALAGYTLLLAGTASLLVRFGNVWDDVRTVLLLVVLMFLATSVTFDEVLFVHPVEGSACYLGGFLLAAVVSECLLWGTRLRLPALYRVPYYLALALYFFYPLGLSPLYDATSFESPRGEAIQWGLYGFSAAAGLVALTLLPAVKRGASYAADNGSPWRWPLYPWVLFGLLGAAVPARAFLLCWSLDPLTGDDRALSMFAPYFLVPFGLAVAVLLLEAGLTSRRRGVLIAALAMPVLLVYLTLIGNRGDRIYEEFRIIFAGRLGCDPLTLTLLMSAIFYGYAALRRVPAATEALTAALVVLAFVGPETMDRHTLVTPDATMLILAGLLQVALSLSRRDAWRCLVGSTGVSVGVALALRDYEGFAPWRWVLAFHLEVVVLLTFGALFEDRLGRAVRVAGATLVALASLGATFGRFDVPDGTPRWAVVTYPVVTALLLAAYGLCLRDRRCRVAAGAAGGGWLVGGGWRAFRALREVIPGLNLIALSLVFFAVAVFVSLAKAGAVSRWLERWLPKPAYRAPLPIAVGDGVARTPDAAGGG